MRRAVLAALLLCCAAPVVAQDFPVMDTSDDGKPREPMGPKPIRRDRFDKIITAMFREGDTNHDGTITIDELNARVEARRTEIIRARFAKVDADGNGTISQDEFFAWQRRMGSAASSDTAAAGGSGDIIPDSILPQAGDDPQDDLLAALIEPLNATVVARANSNYDAGVSLAELLAYEGQHFDTADSNKDGFLTIDELRASRPGGPRPGGPRPPGGFGGPGGERRP